MVCTKTRRGIFSLSVALLPDYKWLLVVVGLPPDLPILFSILFSGVLSTRYQKGLIMLWHVVLWAIWDTRNGVIFSVKTLDLLETFFAIKCSSWKWFLDKTNSGHSLFYESMNDVLILWSAFLGYISFLCCDLHYIVYMDAPDTCQYFGCCFLSWCFCIVSCLLYIGLSNLFTHN